jgi:hypothetical protein
MKQLLQLLLLIVGFSCSSQAQTRDSPSHRDKYPPRFSGTPFITDSLSTLFIPALYNENLFSSDKLAKDFEVYANFIVYDFIKDSYQKLFPNDVYIHPIAATSEQYGTRYSNFDHKSHVFRPYSSSASNMVMRVKSQDTNGNGKVDESDASILYVCDANGGNLRMITNPSESVTSILVYDKMGFALIRFQTDTDKDKSFENDDRGFYFRKLDLKTFETGKVLEIN